MTVQRPPSARNRQAFSLIEVTLAIGIVAFAFIGLFALLPLGLTSLDNAIDATIESQIVQQITTIARQSSFNQLQTQATDATPMSYYFDNQGEQITDTARQQQDYVYTAAVTVVTPPGGQGVGAAVPSKAGEYYNPQIAVVRIVLHRRSSPTKKRVRIAYVANNGIS